MEEKKNEKFSMGRTILILVAALTLGEFSVASVGSHLGAVLMAIALIKAFLIVRDYMHISRLFTSEEDIT